MPKVSVIVSTYNRSKMLSRALESIQIQTIPDIEILVCDDGSTDDTANLVKEISDKDYRVKYVDCGHSGRPAVPRNIGIKNASGEWLAFDDDDDTWNPTKLEVQLFLAEKHNVKAVCTNAFRVDEKEGVLGKYFCDENDKQYTFKDFIDVNPVINSSMMIHRSLIEKCLGYPEEPELKSVGEDYAFWLRVACKTTVYYCSLPLVSYLESSESSIRKRKNLSFEEQKQIVDQDFEKWLKTQDNEIIEFVERETRINESRKNARGICSIASRFIERLRRMFNG